MNLIYASAKMLEIPYYGRTLFAGDGGNLEYLPFIKYRTVHVIGNYKQQLVCAEFVGDSLSEAGFYDGDVAVIELTNNVRNGQLVAVLTPDGMMAKYFYRESDGTIRLEGRNRKYPAKIFNADQVTVQGIVREVVHQIL